MHAAVVGSGPAGTACARALMRRGVKVTLLDVGDDLDPGRQALVSELSQCSPSQWAPEKVAVATDNPTIESRAIPRKLLFGSDYFYAPDLPYWHTQAEGVAATTSFAKGGFSVAWGAAMLPAADCDMADWPLKREDLEPAYRRVLAALPLSGTTDRLASAFPLFHERPMALTLPEQASGLDEDMGQAARHGPFSALLHGQARLAVQVEDAPERRGCYYCGLCLSGCPINAIYNTADEITRMSVREGLRYLPGLVVETVKEIGQQVEVSFLRRADGTKGTMLFDRVFLGAGAINSTRIIMRSRGIFGRAVRLKDGQKFVLPFLRSSSNRVQWPNINALASLFIEAKLPSLSDHWIHLQISTINDMVLKRLKVFPPQRSNARRLLLEPALSRLMVAWCGLHSDHSSQLELTLVEDRGSGYPVLRMANVINPRTRACVRKVSWAMARAGLGFRTLFLAPLVTLSQPGAGCHYGGSFPMGREGGADLLGRPLGMARTHLVDASTFPSIPATTIVLPIMANADRIATEAAAAG